MQRQIFLLERFAGGRSGGLPRYQFGARLDLHGTLDVEALRAALRSLLAKHPVLRSSFGWQPGRGPMRTVAPLEAVPHPPVALDVPGESAVAAMADTMLRDPFDLTQPPLVRWSLLRLSPDHYVLLHVEHHLVHDGVSFRILVQDLAEAYDAMLAGGRPCPSGQDRFALFAEEEQAWLESQGGHSAKAAWLERIRPLLTAEPLEWRADVGSTGQGSNHRRKRIEARTWEALTGSAARRRSTAFTFLLWLLVGVISDRVGNGPWGVGVGYANRWRWRHYADAVGPMVNVLPIMVEAGEASSERLGQTVLQGFQYQELPLSFLLQGTRCARYGERNPLFQVCFTAQSARTRLPGFRGLEVTLTEGLPTPGAKFDVNVIVVPPLATVLASDDGSYKGADDAALIWETDSAILSEKASEDLLAAYLGRIEEELGVGA